MCRNIRILANFDPPATQQEIDEAALQFVRKVSGMRIPSSKNAAMFEKTVKEISKSIATMLNQLEHAGKKRNRDVEAAKRIMRSQKRFSGDSNRAIDRIS